MIIAMPRDLRCPYNNTNPVETLQKAGFKFPGDDDGGKYYQYLNMPQDWIYKNVGEDIILLDEKERARVKISRPNGNPYADILPRFSISHSCDYDKSVVVGKVLDSNGVVIFETEPAEFFEETNHKSELIASRTAGKICFVWLMRNYPDWQDLAAYWD